MKIDVPTRFEVVRTRSGGESAVTLRGTASVTYDGTAGTEYRLSEHAVERIADGAFARALAEGQDVVATYNHSKDHVLGRTGVAGAPGTLRLRADAGGLHYEVDLPDTQTGRDVATLIERGDLRASSFAFLPRAKAWTREGDRDVLLVRDLDLYDVSVVTVPAYAGTAVSMRDADRAALDADLAARRATAERFARLAALAD